MPQQPVKGDVYLVRAARIVLAVVAAAALVAIGAVVALAAPGSLGRAASPQGGAAQAVYCPPRLVRQLKAAVAAYQKRILKDRARYFRTHRSPVQRAKFVRLQRHQLEALQRRLKRCT
jgi:hypothetical protein